MPRITGLFIYPVKSLRGCAVSAVELDAMGFVGDRRFMVVDPNGKFLTQRVLPKMARIATQLAEGKLTLSAEGAGSITVPAASDSSAPLRIVSVWKHEGLQAEDCGDAAATWLTNFLKTPARLVRAGARFHRPVTKSAARPGDLVHFGDAEPLLIISQASLDELNHRIQENGGTPVSMDRFRPNLVVEGCDAFAEDTWQRLRSGDVVLRHGGLCARCIVTTTDQLTGARKGKEPLKTLAAFRRDAQDPTDVNFGVNLIQETKKGLLRVGDEITPAV
jgi:uncharacterized protein YcbX